MRYYLLRDNWDEKGKWRLSPIHQCDNWLFSNPPAEYMEPCIYSASVEEEGKHTDYTLAGYASVPVVSKRFKEALVGLKEVDEPYYHTIFEKVELSGSHIETDYFVMIIETQIECVDEVKSSFKKFTEDEPKDIVVVADVIVDGIAGLGR